ncbi:YqgE/AlgH family protein [Shewanella sp. Isolate11]|uniref:YqgE/AlgH family protein n=1 Tax=Shewanella sp. Isolate11 TaxID=2908530 RepID=UPI001EFDA462|nr:YqgE/AlgH family protein [Shewanella sp. Isolate11]MCG9696030.1 YqgE/AlgH family protein [Shewanella sp. Isolate11]
MESLQNHLLLAMPALNDSFFERSVIYLCEHNEQGAMGLMVNKPIGVDVNELLKQMQLEDYRTIESINSQVLLGGPVAQEKGFVLHTPQSQWSSSQQISDQLMLTTSRDVLTSLGNDQAPENFIVALGYAGWKRDQLEQELADNAWLTIPVDIDILFNTPHDERWVKATQSLGFDISQLSSLTGHG